MPYARFLELKNAPLVNQEPIEDGEIRASLTLVHPPGTDLRGPVGSRASPGNHRKPGCRLASPRAAPDLQNQMGEERS